MLHLLHSEELRSEQCSVHSLFAKFILYVLSKGCALTRFSFLGPESCMHLQYNQNFSGKYSDTINSLYFFAALLNSKHDFLFFIVPLHKRLKCHLFQEI